MSIVTRESFIALIEREDEVAVHAIGRCLVHLLNRQTRDESQQNVTKVHNEIGFTPADARCGSITAKYYIKHKSLLDWQIEKWKEKNSKGVPRIAKYWRQMNEEAQKKEMSK